MPFPSPTSSFSKPEALWGYFRSAPRDEKLRLLGFLFVALCFGCAYTLAVASNPTLLGAAFAVVVWYWQCWGLCKIYRIRRDRALERATWESVNGTPKEHFRLLMLQRKVPIVPETSWPELVQRLRDGTLSQ